MALSSERDKMNEQYETIEKLKVEQNISDVIFEGMKAAAGWKKGKHITAQEFEEVYRSFLNASVSGNEDAASKEAKG